MRTVVTALARHSDTSIDENTASDRVAPVAWIVAGMSVVAA
jgi:hypothetical protein